MITYKSTSGKDSGVEAFEIKADSITVKFKKEIQRYLYTYSSAGRKVIELMKSLALANNGLSTFISQNDPKYERKFYP